jgi:FkbM family methyltransferase
MNITSSNLFTRAYKTAQVTGLLNVARLRPIFLSSYFLYKRWYEDPFLALAKRCPELFVDGHILDVGANIGYTACVFAGACEATAKVYAFEPDHTSFTTLAEIVRRKNLGHSVEIFNVAVGDTEGTVDFWHNDEHSADHRIVTTKFNSQGLERSKITRIPVTTIDNFVVTHDVPRISFIKIDVQGYELAVCEGMKQTLRKFPLLSIACEYAPDCMRELGFEPLLLLKFFRSAGYQIHVLTRRAIQVASDDNSIELAAQRFGYVDLLCSKRILG